MRPRDELKGEGEVGPVAGALVRGWRWGGGGDDGYWGWARRTGENGGGAELWVQCQDWDGLPLFCEVAQALIEGIAIEYL